MEEIQSLGNFSCNIVNDIEEGGIFEKLKFWGASKHFIQFFNLKICYRLLLKFNENKCNSYITWFNEFILIMKQQILVSNFYSLLYRKNIHFE